MIRHLLKLVWNRKRSNALMILEICASFLVVFVVATLGLFFLDNYRRPLGFEWKNVWNVRVGIDRARGGPGDGGSPEQAALFERLLREVRSFGAVEAAAGAAVTPFDQGGMGGNWKIDGKDVEMGFDEVTTGFADVMGLKVIAGRWFQEADSGLAWEPVVIDRELARAA
jgi:putative ABC transport system permease protein